MQSNPNIIDKNWKAMMARGKVSVCVCVCVCVWRVIRVVKSILYLILKIFWAFIPLV